MNTLLRRIEELKLASLDRGIRVLGVVSPQAAAGCSHVARLLAETSHRAGTQTLLVDLQRSAGDECFAGDHAAAPWLGWMMIYEEIGPPNYETARKLRQSLQASLERFRPTRHLVSRIALTASDLLTHIMEKGRPMRIGVKVMLIEQTLKLEILHDGARIESLERDLLTRGLTEFVSPMDDRLPVTLARNSLPRWAYGDGELNRLVGWCNLDGSAPAHVEQELASDYQRLVANPALAHRAVFNSVAQMKALFHDELCRYGALVVDLPPVLGAHDERINPLGAIAACDGIVMLCMAGEVHRDSLARTMTLLNQSGANVLGLVVNDARNPSLGSELAREARRLRRLSPRLSRWLESKALANSFLN